MTPNAESLVWSLFIEQRSDFSLVTADKRDYQTRFVNITRKSIK